MKQTAIEWLLEELNNGRHLTDKLIEQAKEMEKQQIIDARLSAPSELVTYSKTTYLEEAEQYYNEKFNK